MDPGPCTCCLTTNENGLYNTCLITDAINEDFSEPLTSVSWTSVEFHHNWIIQSSHDNYFKFNVCWQLREK